MSRQPRQRDPRPWRALVMTMLAHAAIFVSSSHAGEPGATGAIDSAATDPAASGVPPATPDVAPDATGAAEQGSGQATDGALPPRSFGLPRRVGWSWDVELDLGLRLTDDDVDASLGMARLQAGVLRADEPYYYSLGVTGELGGAADRSVGLQATVTHLHAGTWLHLGGSWLVRDRAAASSLALGWSLFGVEWQHRFDDPAGDALLLQLRLPLGTTWFLFTHRPVGRARP